MSAGKPDLSNLHIDTRLVLAGRDPSRAEGAVNPPIHRATTLILQDVDTLYGKQTQTYALDGMVIQDALKQALVAVEGGAGATLAPSGLSACTLALLTMAQNGGELLVTDSVYQPTRRFCDTMLKRLGVSTRYIDPRIGGGVSDLITENTCGVFLESPGSLTFEIMDVPAIAAAAGARGVPVALDNTWSAGVYFKPFAHAVDLSVQALTKYQIGHADAFMGAVLAATPEWHARVTAAYKQLGLFAAPDDAYLVLRGMRTLGVRLERQSASALKIARWLAEQPQVQRVLHPALESHPDHALWTRDFTGASGVFAYALRAAPAAAVKAMFEGYQLFAMGFSWAGYESLAVPPDPRIARTRMPDGGQIVRLSIGLEHADDLISDLAAGFARLQA
ncbi:MAG: cystathionine beta-lyase [Hyphomonadaceae bacterium]|nr:cystathionine beta-lyase [Hyphomonadaceae bacterium]